MPGSSQYLPVAAAPGANVDTQADFAGSPYQLNGFTAGIAYSNRMNKVLRQASMMSAAIAQFIVNELGINVNDDGNLGTLITNFTNAIQQAAGQAAVPEIFGVPFNASLSLPAANTPVVTYDTTLTGNVGAANFVQTPPKGQVIIFVIHQDATGGRSFVWPASVPGATIDVTPNATSIQSFIVDAFNNIRPLSPMTVS